MATAVMLVMIGLVIQITNEVLKVWNRSTDTLRANAEARIAMELLTSDLESAVVQDDGLRWIESIQEDVPSPLDNTTMQTTRLSLMTPAMDRPESDSNGDPIGGDLCAVSYQLVYQDPVDGSDQPEDNLFSLHRRLIDSETTFTRLMGAGNQENFDAWTSGTVDVADEITMASDEYPETSHPSYFLVSNIVDFRVDFYYVDTSTGLVENAAGATVPPATRYGGASPAGTIGPGSGVNFPISYAEITLRVVSDEAMALLRRDLVSQSGMTEQEYIESNSEIFTRRVFFQSQPM